MVGFWQTQDQIKVELCWIKNAGLTRMDDRPGTDTQEKPYDAEQA